LFVAWIAVGLDLTRATTRHVVGGWSKDRHASKAEIGFLKQCLSDPKLYAETISQRVCVNEVLHVTSQVVAGTNYKFTVKACDASKKAASEVQEGLCECSEDECRLMKLIVWSQPWLHRIRITDIKDEGSCKEMKLEQELMDSWVAKNGLNEFGDAKDTTYTNGNSPLVDGSTGKKLYSSKYEYMKHQHPTSPWSKATEDGQSMLVQSSPSGRKSAQEIQIDKWIEKNNRNKYGDELDTVYTGGTPLFDETTGKTISRYEYMVYRHPDKPWEEFAEPKPAVEGLQQENKPAESSTDVSAPLLLCLVLTCTVIGILVKIRRRNEHYQRIGHTSINGN